MLTEGHGFGADAGRKGRGEGRAHAANLSWPHARRSSARRRSARLEELGASQSQQEWIVDAYTLVFAALLLPYGVLADRLGRRGMLFAGLAVFGASSFAAAFATSPAMLIGLRAVMALGGAAVLPATLSIITNVFDDKERAQAIAIWAGGTGLAAAIGPLVGGGLLDAGFWWGSVLLINVPIVAVGLAAITLVVPESRDGRHETSHGGMHRHRPTRGDATPCR